ncbi:universal stress protein [Streptomyces chiangmaiensis]
MEAATGADLLICARDGDRSRLGPHSLGPTTRFVVDHAPCPVLLVWPGKTPPTELPPLRRPPARAATTDARRGAPRKQSGPARLIGGRAPTACLICWARR